MDVSVVNGTTFDPIRTRIAVDASAKSVIVPKEDAGIGTYSLVTNALIASSPEETYDNIKSKSLVKSKFPTNSLTVNL